MVLDVLLGMGSYYFFVAGFLVSGFLLVGAVRGLTSGDFYFLSLSTGFMYLIYNKTCFLFEFR